MKTFFKILGIVVVGLILLIIVWPFGTINAGERGVLLRWGAVTGKIYGEGLYFRVPIMDRIVNMDVQVQKEQVDASAASKDLQSVNSTVAVNFHISPEVVAHIYQDIGEDYKVRLIDPALQE